MPTQRQLNATQVSRSISSQRMQLQGSTCRLNASLMQYKVSKGSLTLKKRRHMPAEPQINAAQVSASVMIVSAALAGVSTQQDESSIRKVARRKQLNECNFEAVHADSTLGQCSTSLRKSDSTPVQCYTSQQRQLNFKSVKAIQVRESILSQRMQ
jgi:hypothetical protein